MNHTNSFFKMLQHVDETWTLFLDRDGVINEEKNKDYVKSVKDFALLPKVPAALQLLQKKFGKTIVVTNQKGVSLQLMTQKNLDEIHQHMENELAKAAIRFDLILACTDIHNDSFLRKPQAGMAYAAKSTFPTINFSKSIMVGNSHSDLLFARNAGMYSVFLTTTKTLEEHQNVNADIITDSLWSFANLFNA